MGHILPPFVSIGIKRGEAEVANKEAVSRLASQILRLLEGEGMVDPEGGLRLPHAYTHEELGAMIGAGRVAVTLALGELQDEGPCS